MCLSQRPSFTPSRINDRINVKDWYCGLPDGKGFTPFDFQSELKSYKCSQNKTKFSARLSSFYSNDPMATDTNLSC